MKIKLLLIGLVLLVGTYIILSAPATKVVKAQPIPFKETKNMKMKGFVATKKVSLKEIAWSWLPDLQFFLTLNGTCFYDQEAKYSYIEIEDAFYYKPAISSVERFDYGTKEYNPFLYSSEAYLKLQYYFLAHSNWPLSPFSGYEEIWVMCTPWGSIQSDGKLTVI